MKQKQRHTFRLIGLSFRLLSNLDIENSAGFCKALLIIFSYVLQMQNKTICGFRNCIFVCLFEDGILLLVMM